MNLYKITYKTGTGEIETTYVLSNFMTVAILKAINALPFDCTVISADLAHDKDFASRQDYNNEPEVH